MIKNISVIIYVSLMINFGFCQDNVLSDFSSSKWHKADGYSNGSMFNCTWRASQVNLSDARLVLTLENDAGKPPYKSGEYRTNAFYGYGTYEVKMKPARNAGIVSSFFTYSGPSDGKPWDEIDIEFLGKDTTRIQFNYFTNGQGNHEHIYKLGFDASLDFHTYGFKWEPGRITWFVDGKKVFSATDSIPVTPGRIMVNLWPGTGVDDWLGQYDGKTPLSAYYDGIKFIPE
jgi:beta-glucanase (GH16 family)